MGLHRLDFGCYRIGDDGRFVLFQVSKGSVHRRRAPGFFGHVSIPGAPTGCVAILCGDVCLRRLRTRNRRLDVEFSEPVSRFGSSYHGRSSCFVVLGPADGWLLGWDVVAENIRQSQGAYWRGYRGPVLSVERAVWINKGF